MSVAAIVLAAGRGARIGGPKALLAIEGTTFVARVVETARAAGADPVVVVVAPGAPDVAGAVPDEPAVRVVVNPEPERGQLSSLKVGAAAAGDVDGVLAWPVDHPLVRVETVRAILAHAKAHAGLAVVPRHGGRGGHPTFFPRAMLRALLDLPASASARDLGARDPAAVAHVEVGDPGVVRDIDTSADYAGVPR